MAERLTYREIASRLGITVEAAKARARRGRWHKVLDNHGTARVEVPDDALSPPEPPTPPPPPAAPMPSAERADALRDAVDTLRRELDRQADARDKAEALARTLIADLTRERAERDRLASELATVRAELSAATSPRNEPPTPPQDEPPTHPRPFLAGIIARIRRG